MVLVMCGRSDIGHVALIHSWRHIDPPAFLARPRALGLRLLATQGAWSSMRCARASVAVMMPNDS